MKRSITALIGAIVIGTLAGCAIAPIVDDGRDINEQFLFDMTAYAAAAAALRPANVRSASVNDSDCDTQYELPFEAITADGVYNADTRIAWMRAIGVDENLNVIASVPSSGVRQGDVITGVAGHTTSQNGLELISALREARDRGRPFALQLDNGKQVTITPLKVCLGKVVIASPLVPAAQEYHWTQSVHPLEVSSRRAQLARKATCQRGSRECLLPRREAPGQHALARGRLAGIASDHRQYIQAPRSALAIPRLSARYPPAGPGC